MKTELKYINPYRILGLIFNRKNKEICSNCPRHPGIDGGCCRACQENAGHFKREEFSIMSEAIIQYGFRNVKNGPGGFFGKDKKCVLPRQLRSLNCLGYRCEKMKLTEDEHILLKYAIAKIKIEREIHDWDMIGKKGYEKIMFESENILNKKGYTLKY